MKLGLSLLIAAQGLFVSGCVRELMAQTRSDDNATAAEMAAKMAGISLGLEAMESDWKVPINEDARPLLKQVFERFERHKVYDGEGREVAPIKVANELTKDSELVSMIRLATSKPRVTIPILPADSFAEFARHKQLVKLLAIAARGEAQQGHWALAKERLLVACRVSNWLNNGPGFLSGLVRHAADAMILGACTKVLQDTNGAPEAVSLTQDVADTLPSSFDLRNCFPFETQLSHLTHTDPDKVAAPSLVPLFGEAEPHREPLTAEQKSARRILAADILRLGVLQLQAVRTPGFPAQYDALIKATASFKDKSDAPSVEFFMDMAKEMKEAELKALAMKAMSRIVAAAYEARRSNGSWPVKCPMPQTLNDRRGFVLRYVAGERGLMVYMLGPNGKDDGGIPITGQWRRNSGVQDSDDFGIGIPGR